MPPFIDARERLIVALDVVELEQARRLVGALDGVASFFKFGSVLGLTPGGIEFASELIATKKRVFLDHKYLDVEETVRMAVKRAAAMGVTFLTIHPNGIEMMKAAVENRGSHLKILCVTVLTSMDRVDIAETTGRDILVEDLVVQRARKAHEAGCDGVIASGHEARLIRDQVSRDLLIVTPGIRPAGMSAGGHKRQMTPGQAVRAGADYLVVGRPIIEAHDPRVAAERIRAEMQDAFNKRE